MIRYSSEFKQNRLALIPTEKAWKHHFSRPPSQNAWNDVRLTCWSYFLFGTLLRDNSYPKFRGFRSVGCAAQRRARDALDLRGAGFALSWICAAPGAAARGRGSAGGQAGTAEEEEEERWRWERWGGGKGGGGSPRCLPGPPGAAPAALGPGFSPGVPSGSRLRREKGKIAFL